MTSTTKSNQSQIGRRKNSKTITSEMTSISKLGEKKTFNNIRRGRQNERRSLFFFGFIRGKFERFAEIQAEVSRNPIREVWFLESLSKRKAKIRFWTKIYNEDGRFSVYINLMFFFELANLVLDNFLLPKNK